MPGVRGLSCERCEDVNSNEADLSGDLQCIGELLGEAPHYQVYESLLTTHKDPTNNKPGQWLRHT